MTEMENNKREYILLRNDKRLSNEVYTYKEAKEELDRWNKILTKWPDGSKVKIETFNSIAV